MMGNTEHLSTRTRDEKRALTSKQRSFLKRLLLGSRLWNAFTTCGLFNIDVQGFNLALKLEFKHTLFMISSQRFLSSKHKKITDVIFDKCRFV